MRGEFCGAEFADARLSQRLVKLAESIAARPEESLPHALQTEKELDAGYRFFNNDAVNPAAILEPHRNQTTRRMKDERLVLVAHDTTSLTFGGRRKGLGRVSGAGNGFFLHASLAMTADGLRRPLGVIESTTWVRAEEARNKLPNGTKRSGSSYATLENRESARWANQIEAVASRVQGDAQLIHLMDREGDSYELVAHLVEGSHRFVLRSSKDRTAREDQGAGDWEHLRIVEKRAEFKAQRNVTLSRRAAAKIPSVAKTFPERDERTTTLTISAMIVELRCPRYLRTNKSSSLKLNLVRVAELAPPDDLEPIDWCLLTTEPIDTQDATLAIVDYYRGRWLIEEYFKALKTGCEVEKLQLESYDALRNAVSVYLPIAADILRLRNLADREPDATAEHVLSPTQIAVLRTFSPLPLSLLPTIAEVHLAIAMLGGYQRHKRRPGWLVLARGWQDLLMYERGWTAREKSQKDVGDL
jgi:hypothetical protein